MRYLLLFLLTISPGAVRGEVPTAAELTKQGWDAASFGLVTESFDFFTRAVAADPSRENRYGLALALLNVPPKSDGNLDRASEMFQTLRNEKDDDAYGVASMYWLARVEEVHRLPRRPERAVIVYKELEALYPGTLWAEMSAAKRCTIELCNVPPSQVTLENLQQWKQMADTVLKRPETKRELYFAIASAASNQAQTDEIRRIALECQIAADAVGSVRRTAAATGLIRVGTLGILLNEPALALDYYNRYLTRFNRDVRRYLVEQIITNIKAGKTGEEALP